MNLWHAICLLLLVAITKISHTQADHAPCDQAPCNQAPCNQASCNQAPIGKCKNDPLTELTFQISGSNLLWPCESTKNIYIQSGRYVPRNVIVTRAQLMRDYGFLALPRYKQGVPFTLGKVDLKKGLCQAKIAPYPCWAIQEEGNCQALQSVVDIAVDPNGLLWALDVGIVNTLEQPIRRCSPKIVAINTADGKVVKSIDMTDLVTAESRLQFIAVDYSKDNLPFVGNENKDGNNNFNNKNLVASNMDRTNSNSASRQSKRKFHKSRRNKKDKQKLRKLTAKKSKNKRSKRSKRQALPYRHVAHSAALLHRQIQQAQRAQHGHKAANTRMKIYIKTLIYTTFEVELQSIDGPCIGDIKAQIEAREHFPRAQQILIHAGMLLPNDNDALLLKELKITTNTILYLFLRFPKSTQIYRRNLNGNIEKLLVLPSELMRAHMATEMAAALSGTEAEVTSVTPSRCASLDLFDFYTFYVYKIARGSRIVPAAATAQEQRQHQQQQQHLNHNNNNTLQFYISSRDSGFVIPMEMQVQEAMQSVPIKIQTQAQNEDSSKTTTTTPTTPTFPNNNLLKHKQVLFAANFKSAPATEFNILEQKILNLLLNLSKHDVFVQ